MWENGRFTGKLARDFNVGERKRVSLRPFGRDCKIYAAYGDTLSDVPLLERSKNPVAVYPDEPLRQTALERGWRARWDFRGFIPDLGVCVGWPPHAHPQIWRPPRRFPKNRVADFGGRIKGW